MNTQTIDHQHALWWDTTELRDACTRAGWRWRLVGGAVRNMLLGYPIHDVDIEVVGVDIHEIAETFAQYGAKVVGSSKPIVRFRIAHMHVDISTTSHADIATAVLERDVTINAIVVLPDGTLVDEVQGCVDARAGILRHINDGFVSDPVRILRLMRMAAEYELSVAPETVEYVRAVLQRPLVWDADRVWHEWRLWTLAPFVRRGLEVLAQTGMIAHYPELAALQGCAQDAQYHPEGDVWVHTGHVCAAAAQISDIDVEQRIVLLLAALCHDLGKPETTSIQDDRIVSPGHAAAGVPLTTQLLARLHVPQRYWAAVEHLVREHMVAIGTAVTPRSVRRLAQRLAPATIEMWGHLTYADSAGRPPLPATAPGAPFVEMARSLHVAADVPVALVRGTDVMALGVAAGPAVGKYLALAYEAQLDGAFATAAEGVAWLQTYMAEAHEGGTP